MKKKKGFWIMCIIVGFILGVTGMTLAVDQGGSLRNAYGVLWMAGCLLCPISINRIARLSYEKEFPDLVDKEKIEYQDERNAMIRNMAKAKSADNIHWALLIAAALAFFGDKDGPLWPAGVLMGIFILRYGMESYYAYKYKKEM
ncbi:hypothetical protein EBB54_20050 [Schaedlerella arabinosiphila]|uniref:Uncharacterized protein n=1 Tax=Schaedlerella arabinosiphila TaxID=2044587 RepID=A0A3R8L241_9FIRM|nr:hypothetical protein [Schaedlerella arabinosiphila]MCI9213590.1 hypothetical protein [Ruminococcus sp.]RRK33380.1 hypothetical protein EBB54_20050 [Schaedlerella arabinosiphila]